MDQIDLFNVIEEEKTFHNTKSHIAYETTMPVIVEETLGTMQSTERSTINLNAPAAYVQKYNSYVPERKRGSSMT